MLTEQPKSPLNSINARALTPGQVAQTFVPSTHFTALCRRRHTIVLGPRGSGKTTLLKMLQPQALATWKHESARAIASQLDFTGIFVATDISWSAQLNALKHGDLDPRTAELLSLASFTTHSLKAVITAFQQRSLLYPDHTPSPEEESRIVSAISKVWRISGISPTFSSLRQALTKRQIDIREVGSREVLLGEKDRNDRLAKDAYLGIPFLPAAGYAIEVFEDTIGVSSGKWAYAFDELELAPELIQAELIRSIRSTDDRFLFKLALNPFTPYISLLQNALSPAPGQDFDQISLWYAERRTALNFCEGLWDELLRSRGAPEAKPKEMLGTSYFESSVDDMATGRGAYAPGSRWTRRFKALADRDDSFKAYLAERDINLNELHLMNDEVRAAEVRKVAPIVALRDFYLREGKTVEGPSVLRSRKTATLYTGADSVFAVTEGNPRVFIGLVGALLEAAPLRGGATISPQVQADELVEAAEKFLATLRTIPVESPEGNSLRFGDSGVVGLIRRIARYFHDDAVRGPFTAAPVGSFKIDAAIPEEIIRALVQALNAGAIIYVPDNAGKVILSSLRGKTFRLSYLLAPLYGFPIRLGRSVSLSSILGLGRRTVISPNLPLKFPGGSRE